MQDECPVAHLLIDLLVVVYRQFPSIIESDDSQSGKHKNQHPLARKRTFTLST